MLVISASPTIRIQHNLQNKEMIFSSEKYSHFYLKERCLSYMTPLKLLFHCSPTKETLILMQSLILLKE